MYTAPKTVPVGLIESLIHRKQPIFALHPGAITNECEETKNGEFLVRAEARIDLQDTQIDWGTLN